MITAVLGLALAVPAASAAPLPTSNTPLTGSSFQGGDGNQDDAAPFIDWQALQAAGRVVHSPDPNAEDTAFTGGSKVLRPVGWDRTVEPGGVKPAKVNILDAWTAVDQPGSDTFPYLGFVRADESGTAATTFELNRARRLWDNGKTRIPCRTTGDVLVATVPQGNRVEITLSQWITVEAHAAPRVLVWADYDDDASEPFSITDDDGLYVIDDIRPPNGTYRLREELAPLGHPVDVLAPERHHAGRVRRGAGWRVRLRLGADRGRDHTGRRRPRLRELAARRPDRREGAVAGRRPGPVRPDRQRRHGPRGRGRRGLGHDPRRARHLRRARIGGAGHGRGGLHLDLAVPADVHAPQHAALRRGVDRAWS